MDGWVKVFLSATQFILYTHVSPSLSIHVPVVTWRKCPGRCLDHISPLHAAHTDPPTKPCPSSQTEDIRHTANITHWP